MVCNGLLAPVAKADIADDLPPGTRDRFEDFVRCDACGNVYWEGLHHPELVRIVTSVTE